MIANVLDYTKYREYLRKEFSGTGEGRGRRTHLAKYLNCQTSFLSQVLTDRVHLSMEHAIKASEFLKHNEEEKAYFMLLVQKDKAGSKSLEAYFQQQLSAIKKNREEIKERIKIKSEPSAADQMKYYSAWFYSAVHILCALPGLNSAEQISKKLKLDSDTVAEALTFLETKGFIKRSGGHYAIGPRRLHLPKGSPMLPRHHSNWRMRAIESVDHEKPEDLHYSAVLGIAKSDIGRFKEKLLKLLEEFEPMIHASKEECPVVLLMDFFEV